MNMEMKQRKQYMNYSKNNELDWDLDMNPGIFLKSSFSNRSLTPCLHTHEKINQNRRQLCKTHYEFSCADFRMDICHNRLKTYLIFGHSNCPSQQGRLNLISAYANVFLFMLIFWLGGIEERPFSCYSSSPQCLESERFSSMMESLASLSETKFNPQHLRQNKVMPDLDEACTIFAHLLLYI